MNPGDTTIAFASIVFLALCGSILPILMIFPPFTEGGTVGDEFMKNEVQLQAGVLGLKDHPPFNQPFDISFALKANQRLKNWNPQ